MPRSQRCAACKAPVPPAAAFCPGCGRFVADDEKALELEIMAPVREQPRGDAVVRVGAGEQTRRQLMVIGAVLLLVIVLAVFLGRGRSKKAAPAPTSVSSTTAQTTAVSPPTTSPETSAVDSSAVPDTTTPTIEHFTPVGQTDGVVVVATSTGLARIDLGAGITTSYPVSGDTLDLITAVRDGVFFRQGGQRINFYSFAPTPKQTSLPFGPGLIGTPDGEGIVVQDNGPAEPQILYIGADLVAHPPPITLPTGYPVGVAKGAVLLQTNGLGVYRLDLKTARATRVLDGSYLASRGDEVAGIVCDEALRCELQATVNGRLKYHRPLPRGLSLNATGGATLSPDGKQLAYIGFDPAAFVAVVNLATGEIQTTAAGHVDTGQVAWTPSGGAVLWVQRGVLLEWSQGTTETLEIPSHEDIMAFAVA